MVSAFSVIALSSSASSAAPPFTPAYNLSNDLGKAQDPNVQSSGSHVYVSWTEGGNGILFRTSADNGTTWSPPLNSSGLKLSPKGGTTQEPLMAAFGSDVYVVWSQTSKSDPTLQVYIATSTDFGVTFSPAVLVDPSPYTPEITPVVAAYGSTVYVAWSANAQSVVAASTNYGASFGAPFTYSSMHEPQLAASGSYGYAVADAGALYVTSNNGSTWRQVYIGGCCGSEPWVEASGSNVVVTWETKATASQVYVASSQNYGATWTSAMLLSSQIPDSWAPMLALQGNTSIIAWRSNPGGSLSQEYSSVSQNAGLTWSNATAIGIVNHDNQWPFTVALSGSSAFVMWSEKVQSNSASADWQTLITYSSDGGNTWTSPISLTNSALSGAHAEQDIATGSVASFGTHAFVAWQNNASSPQVYFASS
jgi:hypothetical protein